jgi:hypothetical protein
MPVAGIARVRQQDFLAGIEQGRHDQQQGAGSARGDGHTGGLDGHAITSGVVTGDGFAQGR